MQYLPNNSIDSIVTDPPYGLSFMGKKWDYDIPSVAIWKEALRILKPGGHILCACGTRTQHRMAVNIEEAGFEIRDIVTWLYGSGFPKSLDISKAIDKQAGAKRESIGKRFDGKGSDSGTGIYQMNNGTSNMAKEIDITTPATNEAKQWEGWGSALKPATEFWTLARKPLSEKTITENVLKHGTGGINIAECKIGNNQRFSSAAKAKAGTFNCSPGSGKEYLGKDVTGRFPANVIFDEFTGAILDEQSGYTETKRIEKSSIAENGNTWGGSIQTNRGARGHTDSGGASRFFYCAKASKAERGEGNNHPTVKPIKLLEYLIKLITPPRGTVLDPFAGSGSTGIAALNAGFNYLLIERELEYVNICKERITEHEGKTMKRS